MKLWYEGSMHDTYDMASGLICSYEVLEESEWFEHFADIIGSFCEIFGLDYWATNFTDLSDVRNLKKVINSVSDQSEGDLYVLRLVNTVLELFRKDAKYESLS